MLLEVLLLPLGTGKNLIWSGQTFQLASWNHQKFCSWVPWQPVWQEWAGKDSHLVCFLSARRLELQAIHADAISQHSFIHQDPKGGHTPSKDR